MSKKPETKIENDFCEWVQNSKYKALAIKLVLFGMAGWPDRTVLAEGKAFFIEFKHGSNSLQHRQIYWKRIIEKLGFNYYVCYSKKEAIEVFLKEMGSA